MIEPVRKNALNSPANPSSANMDWETTRIKSHPVTMAPPSHMGMLIREYVLSSSSCSALAVCFGGRIFRGRIVLGFKS